MYLMLMIVEIGIRIHTPRHFGLTYLATYEENSAQCDERVEHSGDRLNFVGPSWHRETPPSFNAVNHEQLWCALTPAILLRRDHKRCGRRPRPATPFPQSHPLQQLPVMLRRGVP